jgi:hypothetical protein
MAKQITKGARIRLDRILSLSLSIASTVQNFVDGESVGELFGDIQSDTDQLKKAVDGVNSREVDFEESE